MLRLTELTDNFLFEEILVESAAFRIFFFADKTEFIYGMKNTVFQFRKIELDNSVIIRRLILIYRT